MGTHPIFESDFDCLTVMEEIPVNVARIKVYTPKNRQALFVVVTAICATSGEICLTANPSIEMLEELVGHLQTGDTVKVMKSKNAKPSPYGAAQFKLFAIKNG